MKKLKEFGLQNLILVILTIIAIIIIGAVLAEYSSTPTTKGTYEQSENIG